MIRALVKPFCIPVERPADLVRNNNPAVVRPPATNTMSGRRFTAASTISGKL
jgi:hypothetical protein